VHLIDLDKLPLIVLIRCSILSRTETGTLAVWRVTYMLFARGRALEHPRAAAARIGAGVLGKLFTASIV